MVVKGSGLAACCCLRLLREGGVAATVQHALRPGVPVILLSAQTCRLFSGLFDDPGLFDSCHTIRRRIVAWGAGAEPRELPHFARAVPESDLLDRLWAAMPEAAFEARAEVARWSVVSMPDEATRAIEQHFGTRCAHAVPVVLAPSAHEDACWVESVPAGWLFLTAAPGRRAWLLAVGADLDSVFAQSSLVAGQIAEFAGTASAFPSYPRILSRLHGEDWLACGTAAMRFDPICGEGSAHALREAILAAAVVRRLAGGDDPSGPLEHYSSRLYAGFLRHIEASRAYYETGGDSAWWKGELESLHRAAAWTGAQLAQTPPRYALRGLDLVPLGAV